MSENENDLNSLVNICSFFAINLVFIVLCDSELMQIS